MLKIVWSVFRGTGTSEVLGVQAGVLAAYQFNLDQGYGREGTPTVTTGSQLLARVTLYPTSKILWGVSSRRRVACHSFHLRVHTYR